MTPQAPTDLARSRPVPPVPLCRRILVAHDLSRSGADMFSRALSIAQDAGAGLFLAHVDDPSRENMIGFVPAESYERWAKDRRDYVRRLFEPLVAQARQNGVEAEVLALVGPSARELLRAAQDHGADLIVVGFHHYHSWIERFFRCNTAVDLLKFAPCPVLVIPVSPDE